MLESRLNLKAAHIGQLNMVLGAAVDQRPVNTARLLQRIRAPGNLG
ncbi:hypothetical protein [Streptomyces sirii]